jgi:signal transduction histidine kinase
MDESTEWPTHGDSTGWGRSCRKSRGGSRGGWWPSEADPFGCSHEALMRFRRDLHDQIGSTLAGIAMQLELALRSVGTDAGTAHVVLSELRSDIADLIAKVRRIGDGLNTPSQIRNLEAALRSMIRRANRAMAPRLELSLSFDPRVSSVPETVRSAAFWIVSEAVINVLKHSTARLCTVALSVQDDKLHVHVEDDGRVEDGGRTEDGRVGDGRVGGDGRVAARGLSGGRGLANMSARAAEQDGWCTAGPREPMGFAVTACFPLLRTRD